MGVKFRKKFCRNKLLFIIVTITAIGLWGNVQCCSAEGKSLTKRRVHDYDEHFGFGLMSDETSVRHGHHDVLDKGDGTFKNPDEDFIISEEVRDKAANDGGGGSDVSKTESRANTVSTRLLNPPDSNGIVYVGCYHTWMQNIKNFPYVKYKETFTYTTCSDFCQERYFQLSLLKGRECWCSRKESFSLVVMEDSNCNVPCPVESIPTSYNANLEANEACGGNNFYSVYCRTNATEDCTDVPFTAPEFNNKPSTPTEIRIDSEPFCASCTGDFCFSNFISPLYDYFPMNDPKSCVLFCKHNVHYMNSLKPQVRAPTKYAVMTWKNDPALGHVIPICRCINELKSYELVDLEEDYCLTSCPGDPTKKCGNSDTERNPSYATIYCTFDPCEDFENETTSDPPTTTSSENPCVSNMDPEACGGTEGTEQTDATTEITGVSNTPTTSQTYPTTEEVNGTTTSEVTFSTMPSTYPSTTSEPTMPSTYPSTSSQQTMPPVGIGCNLICRGTDRRGRYWEACAGSYAEKNCTNKNAEGKVIWKCTDDGQFETDQPDYSGCHSPWVEIIEKEASNINDTASALKYLTDLKTTISDMSESTETSYFGHEIGIFTNILVQVVSKAENVTEDAGKFEEVAEKVVDVSKHLITKKEPWFEMANALRSTVSTGLLNIIEDTSIHLTSKMELSSGMDSYQKDLSLSDSGYYVSAGAMTKSGGGGSQDEAFEFPVSKSSHESFIKLPEDWKSFVPGEKIEFIGMSMDTEFVNLMMPGQFRSLGVDESDKKDEVGQQVKVINSQLMSFTLASSAGSKNNVKGRKLSWTTTGDDSRLSIQFGDTGVQITFEHDLEAWGDGAVDIRRKLHPGEARKVALGSSQCVFWDPKSSIWSTEGCKLISSNRFHTVCECSHLTSFGILMDAHNYVGKELGLEILTLILCSLSFICLFVSVMIFSTIRGVKNLRTTITKNLSVCLLVGNTAVLLVLDRHYLNMSDGLCIASGIITHYVFLSAFIWMAIEGLHLYKMVVHVFDTENNPLNLYRLVSYGLPLVIVAITVVVGYLNGDRPYGGDAVCWLDGPYIWSFMIPVAVIVMVNFVILFIALKTAYLLQHNKSMPVLLQSRVRSFRTWIRGCFSITVLLGLTWLVGFFTLIPSAPGVAAAYVFTILNASQGIFIFVFHCILNDKVRFMTSKRFGSYLPSWLSSSVNNNSTGSQANEASGFGKRAVSNMKNSSSNAEKSTVNKSEKPVGKIRAKLPLPTSHKDVVSMDATGGGLNGEGGGSISVITPIQTRSRRTSLLRRRDSFGTVSSLESLRPDKTIGSPVPNYSSGSISDSGNNTDNSQRELISVSKSNSRC